MLKAQYTVMYEHILRIRVEWLSTFCNFRIRTHCCESGIFQELNSTKSASSAARVTRAAKFLNPKHHRDFTEKSIFLLKMCTWQTKNGYIQYVQYVWLKKRFFYSCYKLNDYWNKQLQNPSQYVLLSPHELFLVSNGFSRPANDPNTIIRFELFLWAGFYIVYLWV